MDTEKSDLMPARYLRAFGGARPLRRLIYAFTPEILRNDGAAAPPSQQPADSNVSRTAYLDGLRGIAAVVVLNYHFFFSFSDYSKIGYGYNDKHRSLIQLPYVRLLYDGATAVNVFFTIAGYVCSAKALQLASSAQHEKVLRTLCGSIFRSCLRLYLPVLIISFVSANAAYLGAFDIIRATAAHEKLPEANLKRMDSWTGQMHFWATEMFKLTNLWNIGPVYPEHDPHLWSIAFEFRMRMHLYIALLGMALCRPMVRLCGLITLALVYLLWNRWEGPLFFLGAALAQWDQIRSEKKKDLAPTSPSSQAAMAGPRGASRPLRWLMYAVALYFMSFPIANVKYPAPGFILLNKTIPRWYSRTEKFPKSIGVLVLVYLLGTVSDRRQSLWHRILTSNVAQYMGKIMFALYLIHGPVFHVFGYGIPVTIWSWIGRQNALNWWTGLTLGWLCNLFVCLWLAEVFTREVDARLVQVVRVLEKHFFAAR